MHSALHHDRTYMGANMVYRHNRDRVITMGFELHDKARAVHSSRPEFSLTYPNMKKPPSLQVRGRARGGKCAEKCCQGRGIQDPQCRTKYSGSCYVSKAGTHQIHFLLATINAIRGCYTSSATGPACM